MNTLRALLSDESGQGVIEYALILALVSVAAIAALKALGGHVTNGFNTVDKALPF